MMTLHIGEPPVEYYKMKREELELEIARMEDKIAMETRLRPLRYAAAAGSQMYAKANNIPMENVKYD